MTIPRLCPVHKAELIVKESDLEKGAFCGWCGDYHPLTADEKAQIKERIENRNRE